MEQLIVPSTRLSGIDSIFVGLHWSETRGPRGSAESGLTAIDGRACRLGGAGPDVPFVEDGTRFFGSESERARFAALAEDMLLRAGARYQRVSGSWDMREEAARAAITAAVAAAAS